MSSPPPTPSLPLPTISTAPPVAAYTPEEITGVLNDLVTAVQGIWLYLARSYGPPPPLPPTSDTGPPALPWYSPHPGASAAFAGTLQPVLQLPLPPPPPSLPATSTAVVTPYPLSFVRSRING